MFWLKPVVQPEPDDAGDEERDAVLAAPHHHPPDHDQGID
jgi:hypothetical protein